MSEAIVNIWRSTSSGTPGFCADGCRAQVEASKRETGKVLWTEFEADSTTPRHFIDKFVPSACQELKLSVHGAVNIYTNVRPN